MLSQWFKRSTTAFLVLTCGVAIADDVFTQYGIDLRLGKQRLVNSGQCLCQPVSTHRKSAGFRRCRCALMDLITRCWPGR